MSRAESIKAALAPPVPPGPPSYTPARGGGVEIRGARGGRGGQARGRGGVRGRPALSRPTPSAADVRGSTRVRRPIAEGGGGTRDDGALP